MWKKAISIGVLIVAQNAFALQEIDQNNTTYKISSNEFLKYDTSSSELFLIKGKQKINLDLVVDGGVHVGKINDKVVIISDRSGMYPTTPYFYKLENNRLIESTYEYKEIPEGFSYHDGFSCEYSDKNNTEIKFTCSNPSVSKNTKYSYVYKDGAISLLNKKNKTTDTDVCSKTYQHYVSTWKNTKNQKIKWDGNDLPNSISLGLSSNTKVSKQQYARLLNSNNLMSKAVFQQKVCK